MTSIRTLIREQSVPADLRAVWEFFSDPCNLNAITPPDLHFEIMSGGAVRMTPGQLIEYRISLLPGWRSLWLTEIAHVREPHIFVDEQRLGPYRFWYHEHTFQPIPGGVRLGDRVRYALPFGLLGDLAHRLFVRRRLEAIFDFRRDRIAERFGSL